MQKLNPDEHGVVLSLAAARFLIIRLKSRPESTPMAVLIDGPRKTVRVANEDYTDALEHRMALTAEIGYRDYTTDRAVHKVSRGALNHTDNKRDDPYFKLLFPKPASEVVVPVGGEVQKRFVTGLVDTIETDDTYIDLRPQAGSLKTEQTALSDVESRRNALRIVEEKARTKLAIARDELSRAYNLAFHQLHVLFPDDAVLVESFFRTL